MTIFSIGRSKGNYQGNDYDNILFQCFSDYTSKSHLAGTPAETLKVKADVVIDSLGKSLSSVNWDDLIGMDILPQFNKFGQVSSFVLSAESSPAPSEAPSSENTKSSSKK